MTKAIITETGLEIISHRNIRSAKMAFEYRAYARKYDEDIQKLLKKLPTGLKLQGFQHDVKLDPEARGVETYTATHHFDASCEGTVSGRIDLLIGLKRTFKAYPLIEAEDIVLKLA